MVCDNRAFVFMFRFSIFVGLLSAVVTVIYLTPIPELQHASCLRPCHELDWPMICRARIVLDMSTVVTRGQTACSLNNTDCDIGSCGLGGGVHARVLTANGLLPGPAIQVCEKDILVVDVVNRVPGSAMTVHWRGQTQKETPFMDGTPMVTQCPINSFTTFQYKFRASDPGTHLWQVQTGNDGLDTLFGALIVRQSSKKDPHNELYDEDNQFVLISELPIAVVSTGKVPLLINGQPFGQGSQGGYAQLNVTEHKRHRLRIAYSVTSLSCPITLGVEGHSLLVIALDGHPIRPVATQSIRLAPGERVDAVLTADQGLGNYQLSVSTTTSCPTSAQGSAMISYQADHSSSKSLSRASQPQPNQLKSLSTVGDQECSFGGQTDLLCLPKIESLTKMPSDLSHEKLDFTHYIPFDLVKSSPHSYVDDGSAVPRLNNLTYTFSSSPLLTQWRDVDAETVCSAASRPSACDSASVCKCVHVIDIPLNAAVELMLIDQGSVGEHVFHLHGYSFYVVGAVSLLGQQGLEAVKQLDRRGQLFSRNLKNPVLKDTVAVPVGGVVAVRFKADNPGYWFLHEERPSRWSQGLGVILHVGGEDDVPPVPEQFPTCGSWVGPEFFLI